MKSMTSKPPSVRRAELPRRWAMAALVWLAIVVSAASVRASTNISPARVSEIAALLPSQPTGYGPSIGDRAAWARVAANPALKSLIADAEKMALKPDPALPDDLYLDYSRTGNRDHCQAVMFERADRLACFALAECVENRGRFLAPLQKSIETLCSERAWPYPAHDGNLDVFYGRAMNPDLRATTIAFDLAMADHLLGDKLPAATRQLIRDNVRRRVLQPYRDMVEGRLKEVFWMRATHNWNAVCLAGTTGAALALADSPEERAWFVAAADDYISYYLESFTPDGYTGEGVGYWNYGFGRFVMLAEDIRQATDGRLDLFKRENVWRPALFGRRSEIINGIYPTIADVTPGTRPDPLIVDYVRQRLGLGPAVGPVAPVKLNMRSLAESVMVLFREDPLPVARQIPPSEDSPLRTWFADGAVLIARQESSGAPFAVVIKGGHNSGNHSHDDVGSFSVVAGRAMVICDPGGEVYTARTFGPRRFDSKVINSYGHAVPVVAGKLQSTGSEAKAVLLRQDFTDAADTLVFDLRSAYAVPELKKLERTFVYRRSAAGLEVRDAVAFSQPETYESTLITWGDLKRISDDEIEIADDGGAVRVKIDTGGRPFEIHSEIINEDVHTKKKPRHIGIVLKAPVTGAEVSLTITPVTGTGK